MSKLSDLDPTFVPDNHLYGTTGQLRFLCPACRRHPISVNVIEGPPNGPYHGMDGTPPDWDRISIHPSIDASNAKGIGKHCGWHGFITNGEAK